MGCEKTPVDAIGVPPGGVYIECIDAVDAPNPCGVAACGGCYVCDTGVFVCQLRVRDDAADLLLCASALATLAVSEGPKL